MSPRKPARRQRRTIDPALKHEAIQRVLHGEVGAIVARELDVRPDLLYRWVRLYRKAHPHGRNAPPSEFGLIANHERIDELLEERIATLSNAKELLAKARELEQEIRNGLTKR